MLAAKLDEAPKLVNWDYYACGERTLWPSQVYDDGRFTYLRFPNAQEIPAIFIINTDGTNAATVTTNTGWALVGAMAVAHSTTGSFRARKTAAGAWTLYRIS